jgi:uncharacterized protein YuzE
LTGIVARTDDEAALLSGDGQPLYRAEKRTGAEAREIVAGLVADFDANGNVVGFDIDHASRKLDLSKVETIALPRISAAE